MVTLSKNGYKLPLLTFTGRKRMGYLGLVPSWQPWYYSKTEYDLWFEWGYVCILIHGRKV